MNFIRSTCLDDDNIFKFIRSSLRIPAKSQSLAIYAASQSKLKGVMTIADPYGVGVTRLVSALGQLTKELQTGDVGIRNPELGIFKINWVRLRELLKQLGRDGREVDELFRKSELDGFVREVDDKDRIIMRPDPRLTEIRRFRLHHRFAPAFGFSFRGPYSEFTLPESAFIEVVLAEGSFNVKDWVAKIAGNIGGKTISPDQISLPGLWDDEEAQAGLFPGPTISQKAGDDA